MRIKCHFCRAGCYLVRPKDPEWRKNHMVWECRGHQDSGTRVLTSISITERHSHDNYNKVGTIREVDYLKVMWKTDGGIIYRTYWYWSDGLELKPAGFAVTRENPNEVRDDSKDSWWDSEKIALELDDFPKDISPENIKNKISTYIIFS